MSRAARLLDLMELLRRHRHPVAGASLAAQLGISLRSLYRDIATLQAQGAQIEGEAGLGYVLKPGFTLPPLMFSADEVEALVLGSRWVAGRADDEQLAAAARHALAKISAVLPAELRHEMDSTALLVGPGEPLPRLDQVLARLRAAMRKECKVRLHYCDLKGRSSERVVWPFALGFFDQARVLVAWCELRGERRSFRCDQIEALEVLEERYPQRRQVLLKAWREAEGIAAQ
ncbi:helix-turn-helix transcriptional regulator [Paucibacter sp. DJ2R-2]|uniref:helix-turn-helix transcriptional regulator n=1 Tax=Paucibacter sp. DJ2R-2 TaxID=2893558 RepID=UPI0021E500B6|nr:YafY family protein [Paucibacter sp. DJ2R-2]MCV2420699.1 YafY family transcriptional regulator [Paucibacter sp. DJ4R-1]MCV2439898.1 YafY family transcriptional regulator [Paucibacter sp. DJ2R-2]